MGSSGYSMHSLPSGLLSNVAVSIFQLASNLSFYAFLPHSFGLEFTRLLVVLVSAISER